MLEFTILALFILGLILCISLNHSILCALLAGLFLFSFYAWKKGFAIKEIAKMLLEGMKKVKNILKVFVCIGSLTAVWRICGTIPYIVYHSANFIVPQFFILCAFVLCCAFSYLTGSSFAAAGTVGTICMMLGKASGIPALPLGGAIMAGCYYGDRCSPMSSSALLVAEITKTNIYENVKTMFRTSAIPMIISCLLYLGMRYESMAGVHRQSLEIFQKNFELHWVCLIPAAITLIFCLCKVEVKKAMTASIIAGFLIGIFVQKLSFTYILETMFMGYHPATNPELAVLLEGGGISSMINVALIVCLSSSFSGIFEKTGLLNNVDKVLIKLSESISKEGAFFVTATLTCMICCNQSLATILTNQLSKKFEPDNRKRASWMEDTVIVIAALVPWSIASAVPLAILNVPTESLFYAWYLYLIPLNLLVSAIFRNIKRNEQPV